MTGPSVATRALVWARDQGECQWCGEPVESWQPHSLQHRRARGMGGTSRVESNEPGNLVLVHGTGSTGCHADMESRRDLARSRGFNVYQQHQPADIPIRGRVFGELAWLRLLGPNRAVIATHEAVEFMTAAGYITQEVGA